MESRKKSDKLKNPPLKDLIDSFVTLKRDVMKKEKHRKLAEQQRQLQIEKERQEAFRRRGGSVSHTARPAGMNTSSTHVSNGSQLAMTPQRFSRPQTGLRGLHENNLDYPANRDLIVTQ